MKTSYVVISNVIMLCIGLWYFAHYLILASKPVDPSKPELLVSEFYNLSQKIKLPDTLKQVPKFVKLFDIYKTTDASESIDSFMLKLTPKFVPDTVKSKFQDEFEILKTRTDQVLLKKGYKPKNTSISGVCFIYVLIIMGIAGLLGGLLANFRGFFEMEREKKEFPKYLHFPYLIRPLTGGLCGLFVFFLTSVLVSPTTVTIDSEFISFKAMIALIALSILAGFASQEFTEKLKMAVSVLFGASLKVEVKPPAPTSPKAGTIGLEGLVPSGDNPNKPNPNIEISTYTLRNRD